MSLLRTQLSYESGLLQKQQYIDEMYEFHQILFEYSQLLAATDIATIEIVDGGVIFTFRSQGIKIFCNQADKRTAPFEIMNFRAYEKLDSDIIFGLIEPGFNVLDIGANIGWYSLNIARLHASIRVWSFEPIPMTFLNLKKNIEINGMSNIKLHNFGFSNEEKTLNFYLQPGASVSASLANITDDKNVTEISCNVKRLDNFIVETGLNMDFIKCDVEGAELFVYEGGVESIRRDKPIIFTEMLRKWSAKFHYNPNQIISLLVGMGYRCFTARENHLAEIPIIGENTTETNFFFLHSEKHLKQIQCFAREQA